MSLEKLIKILAKTVNTRQEMRDMNDMPIPARMCWCCRMPTGTLYQYAINAKQCGSSLSGSPVKKPCSECYYLGDAQRESGPTYVT
jgi:hypothetical protein